MQFPDSPEEQSTQLPEVFLPRRRMLHEGFKWAADGVLVGIVEHTDTWLPKPRPLSRHDSI